MRSKRSLGTSANCSVGTASIERTAPSAVAPRNTDAGSPDGSACYDGSVTVKRFHWLILVLLTAWVILGPVGMAFDSCAAMMALCDGGPCGAVSAVTDATPSLAPPTSLTVAVVLRSKQFTPVPRSALEPPPKLVRLSS